MVDLSYAEAFKRLCFVCKNVICYLSSLSTSSLFMGNSLIRKALDCTVTSLCFLQQILSKSENNNSSLFTQFLESIVFEEEMWLYPLLFTPDSEIIASSWTLLRLCCLSISTFDLSIKQFPACVSVALQSALDVVKVAMGVQVTFS